ncbi:hypothetical protein LP419_16910 [Massilia sp. H-1]|nr:hypothetical protein LP419_16910 [Massilia sp. H-1]
MKLLNQEEAKRICDRVIGFSKADECSVNVSGTRTGNIRYAQNSVSTAGLNENMQIAVTVAFGKRQGTATINEFDDKSLEKVVRRAEDVARLAPENPEFMLRLWASRSFVRRPNSPPPPPPSIPSSAPRWPPTASCRHARRSW